ncbi:hypothetical protein MLD38_033120 [Melastoma candidum]|uniref:Uncharacterized protein n=1 Tax=Melastoma candidum TaxID=119954 RepID=A0ACB9M6B1_9MYRT|nr:hypothetical protein MLD38_033120 [Melastoma candidum]
MSPVHAASSVMLVALLLLEEFRCVIPTTVLQLQRLSPTEREFNIKEARIRDRARHGRNLQGFPEGVVSLPVQGSSNPLNSGIYLTKVRLGNPPREFRVQIDTGSDVLWIACSSCINCPTTSGLGIALDYLDPASSSTASVVSCSDPMCTSGVPTAATECLTNNNQCGYSFRYGDGSGTSGFYVSDELHFDMTLKTSSVVNSSASVTFGCSTEQTGELTKTEKAIDGIFGFGRGPLSVVSQLSSREIIPKVFSHCLKGDSDGGGLLVLGEILEPNIVYTPMLPSKTHYNLNLQSISVKETVLPIDPSVFVTSNRQGTIVDSGTTLTYLLGDAYDHFVAAVSSNSLRFLSSSLVNSSTRATIFLSGIFPLASLNFAGNTSMKLKPNDYLVYTGLVGGIAQWCIGFERIQQGTMILGDLVLKDKIVVYDLARRRIGWAEHDWSHNFRPGRFVRL